MPNSTRQTLDRRIAAAATPAVADMPGPVAAAVVVGQVLPQVLVLVLVLMTLA